MHALRCLLFTAMYVGLFLLLVGCGGGGTAAVDTANAKVRLFMDGNASPTNLFATYGLGDALPQGVLVELEGPGDVVATTVTNANGEALFGGLEPNTVYYMRVDLNDPALQQAADQWFGDSPWNVSPANLGGDDSIDSDASFIVLDETAYASIKFETNDAGTVRDDLGIGFSVFLV